LSGLLKKVGLAHQVLNAKQHEREAEIIAQAGRPGVITIATNMAGRGTDIVLGGNVEKQAAFIALDPNVSEADKASRIQTLHDEWQGLHDQVKAAGGLHIIGTERHESRRIDNQLRGRAGRQGDPGSSRFYLSLDDTLMRIFAGDRVRAIMDRLKMPEGEAIEAGIVTRSIESAQRKVEGRNYDIRKQLLQYDDVANDQRKEIYSLRNEILSTDDCLEMIQGLRHAVFTALFRAHVPPETMEEQWDLAGLEAILRDEWNLHVPLVATLQASQSIEDETLLEQVLLAADAAYNAKRELAGAAAFAGFERSVLLQALDSHWREHLAALDHLRQGIHLRGYAQKDPKQEYKRESFELFAETLEAIKDEVTRVLMAVRVQSSDELDAASEAIEAAESAHLEHVHYQHQAFNEETANAESTAPSAQQVLSDAPRVGRNEPCPCGSGKKYKHCHGALA
jgi:preprotein translocase subunit SecA